MGLLKSTEHLAEILASCECILS